MGGLDPAHHLAEERAAVAAQAAALARDFDRMVAASADSNADDEHDPEGATIAFERQQLVALLAQVERHLADLDLALEKVTAGTYGQCEVCGRPIEATRLEARPAARTCITCAHR